MKGLRTLVTNPGFLLGVGLYIAGFALLFQHSEFSASDLLVELLIFGLCFSLIAWWATIRTKPLLIATHPTPVEMAGLTAYVIMLSFYLAYGPQWINSWLPSNWIASAQIQFWITIAKKLLVFVVIPFALFGPLCAYRMADFGWQKAGLRELFHTHLPVVLILSGAILAFQYFVGGGAAPLREGKLTTQQLVLGLPLCFLWLAIEAGLVEEFFFRALLQARLSAWFRSEITGIALMALIFGLAHAPGFIFRRAGTVEGLGPNPSPLDAIAYSIVVLAVSGVFFGIVWARTKNLFALITIHAATDLLPNLAEFVRTWGL